MKPKTSHLRLVLASTVLPFTFMMSSLAFAAGQDEVISKACSAPADLSEAIIPKDAHLRARFDQMLQFFKWNPYLPSNTVPEDLLKAVGQAVGFYSRGRLQEAANLGDSDGYLLKLFISRNRGWGTSALTGTLSQVALTMKQSFPDGERLQIGDITQKSGGQITRHASHQNGLDVDLSYFRLNRREQDPTYEKGFDETFVKNNLITGNFDVDRNWNLVFHLVSTGRINRIFVGTAIKRAFCQYAIDMREHAIITETLRRLRPYPNHDDHMHVRFNCPSDDSDCVSQIDPPIGDGCQDVL